MLQINTPDSPYSEQVVTVSGIVLTLIMKYNIINESWYMDIKNSTGEVSVLDGVKLIPNQNLTGRYILPKLVGGDFWCFRNKDTDSPITRDNLGIDEEYSLYWVTDEDIEEAGLDGILQL